MSNLAILFISFIFYSFLGWCFEMVHMGITTKEIVNRGFLNGPVIPVYGVGGMLVLFLLRDIKDNILLTMLLIVLICSILEYITSVLMEKLFKMRWWDYEDMKFNLNGRICLNIIIIFLCLALGVVYLIDPIFTRCIDTLSANTINIIAMVLLVLFILDVFFTLFILKKYKESNKVSKRKDKTPAIREFTWEYIRRKV